MKNNRFFILLNQWVNKGILGLMMDWLLPARCPLTGAPVERQGMVAPEAWAKLRFVAAPQCYKCGVPLGVGPEDADFEAMSPPNSNPNSTPNSALHCTDCLTDPPPFAAARAALVYDDASRKLVLGFKHADQTYAVKTFLPWLHRAGAGFWPLDPVLVPVPLHRWRLLRRRYNQAALLARALSRAHGHACVPDLLQRVRATPAQAQLKAAERARNVAKAFAVNPRHAAKLGHRHVVLIDDVLTTGATVRECADVLLKAGAASVQVLTIARTVKN